MPRPVEDMKNLWSLCKTLRGQKRPQIRVQSELNRAQQLPTLVANVESSLRDDEANKALHTLEWRCLAIGMATMYADMKPNHDEIRKAWTVATGKRPDVKRDVTLDWLTGQLFSSVTNIYKLSTKDWRRKKVEHWLRVACPVFSFKNKCGFAALIAPGMRISDSA